MSVAEQLAAWSRSKIAVYRKEIAAVYGRKEIAAAWPQLLQLRYDRKRLKTARKARVQKEKTLLRYGPANT